MLVCSHDRHRFHSDLVTTITKKNNRAYQKRVRIGTRANQKRKSGSKRMQRRKKKNRYLFVPLRRNSDRSPLFILSQRISLKSCVQDSIRRLGGEEETGAEQGSDSAPSMSWPHSAVEVEGRRIESGGDLTSKSFLLCLRHDSHCKWDRVVLLNLC